MEHQQNCVTVPTLTGIPSAPERDDSVHPARCRSGRIAANGVWDVTIREAGTKVTDRTDADPANWIISEPAMGVVADRDFSADDFVGSPRQPKITEMYAPRAAVYEACRDSFFA